MRLVEVAYVFLQLGRGKHQVSQGSQPLLARNFFTQAADCLKYFVVAASCGKV
jgi:hypothetical protein